MAANHDLFRKQSGGHFSGKGIVLPVSAVILANQEGYVHALERFSKPLQARTTYNPDVPETPATGNDALYFRYFDATDQASFLYWALERTVEQDLAQEITYLLGFDAAYTALKSAETKLGRTVNPTVYTPANWRRKHKEGNAFVVKVGRQSKVFLIGTDEALA